MKRDILKIDEELCNGCGLCVPACHEGALEVIDGKLKLVSELLCDGLGACLGHCPVGAITIESRESEPYDENKVKEKIKDHGRNTMADQPSELTHWPVQMHLLNPSASNFRETDLLLSADCVAFSMGNFHSRYLRGKTLAIACPKLDHGTDIYIGKLTALIETAKVNTITVMMMEVPCCGGLMQLVKAAQAEASWKVPVKQLIISVSGSVLKEEWV